VEYFTDNLLKLSLYLAYRNLLLALISSRMPSGPPYFEQNFHMLRWLWNNLRSQIIVNITYTTIVSYFRTDSIVGTDEPAIKLVLLWDSRIVRNRKNEKN
jgi:hypothetical protein